MTFPLGTLVYNTYNQLLTGVVVGHGVLVEHFEHGVKPDASSKPVYLVKLAERLVHDHSYCVVTVMTWRADHTEMLQAESRQ